MGNGPYSVLGGWILSVGEWEELELEWREALARTGLRRFKMSELSGRNGTVALFASVIKKFKPTLIG